MKVVLITGASSGIGRATALHFLKQGWMVAAAMRRPDVADLPCEERLRRYALDVTEPVSVCECVAAVERDCGGIDVLVNNAGVYLTKPLEDGTDADYAAVFGTNVQGTLRVTRAVLPGFRCRRAGMIVNVSSVAGRVSFPFQSLYHGSKWAIEGWSEGLAHELRPQGIRMKLVEPGMVRTPLYDRTRSQGEAVETEAYREDFASWRRYLLRCWEQGASPEASARAIFRAANDDSNRLRYTAGADTRQAFILRAVLSQRAWDWLVRRLTGLRGQPELVGTP